MITPEMLSAILPGVGKVAESVVDMSAPEVDPYAGRGATNRYDLASIRNQEFQRTDKFDLGTVGALAGAGSAIAPGIGTLVGAGAGLLIEGVGEVGQLLAKRKFNKDRDRLLQNATQFNAASDYADRMRQAQSLSARIQAQRIAGVSDGL